MSGNEGSPHKKKRKGVIHAFKYKANVIKKARVKHVPYKNWKGNLVPGKTQGGDCK